MKKLIAVVCLLTAPVAGLASNGIASPQSEQVKEARSVRASSDLAIMTYITSKNDSTKRSSTEPALLFKSRSNQMDRAITGCEEITGSSTTKRNSVSVRELSVKQQATSLVDDIYKILDSAINATQRSIQSASGGAIADGAKTYPLISVKSRACKNKALKDAVIQL